eukprot:TRINITY_DN7476_c0_g2_i2.p1 TRINITY_DN7476_c0_g2~~TRINITY_DN7476_c0_g2_i2.p1  ORF type:complete len:185 (+),score=32.98 TRINITY_DN7476_c0_g2_i2:50-556(+)
MLRSLVGSEMCIRDRSQLAATHSSVRTCSPPATSAGIVEQASSAVGTPAKLDHADLRAHPIQRPATQLSHHHPRPQTQRADSELGRGGSNFTHIGAVNQQTPEAALGQTSRPDPNPNPSDQMSALLRQFESARHSVARYRSCLTRSPQGSAPSVQDRIELHSSGVNHS